jgi:hypothetical protein
LKIELTFIAFSSAFNETTRDRIPPSNENNAFFNPNFTNAYALFLRKLPKEVWRDCFDWLSPKDRKQVARKLNDINDYEFINLCEKWLHEWTKNVCLGPLYIGDSGLACVQCWNEQMQRFELEEFPIAETEMPVNIKSFNWIIIRFILNSASIVFM